MGGNKKPRMKLSESTIAKVDKTDFRVPLFNKKRMFDVNHLFLLSPQSKR